MVYVYKCEKCGEMEIEHSIKDPAMTICPICQTPGFHRIPTLTQFNCTGKDWAFKEVHQAHKKRWGK